MKKNNVLRLSHLISSHTPSYGNRDYIKIEKKTSIVNGNTANTSSWLFSNNHIGTHLDVPYHFNQNGKKTYEYDTNEWFFQNVELVDMPLANAYLINAEDLKENKISDKVELLLFRTGFENFRNESKYYNDNPGIHPDLAGHLRINFPHLRCIGFDFISVTSWKYRQEGRESHKNLLSPEVGLNPILAIEDMSLAQLNSKIEWVIVSPLFMEDGNGGPVTVFANTL